jgi:hypothetical protein
MRPVALECSFFLDPYRNSKHRRLVMKTLSTKMSQLIARRDSRVIFFLLTIAMYIISAGAPDASGGVGM